MIYHKYNTSTKADNPRIGDLNLVDLPEISQTEKVGDAIRILIRSGAGKALVFSRDQKLIGMLTMMDLTRAREFV